MPFLKGKNGDGFARFFLNEALMSLGLSPVPPSSQIAWVDLRVMDSDGSEFARFGLSSKD